MSMTLLIITTILAIAFVIFKVIRHKKTTNRTVVDITTEMKTNIDDIDRMITELDSIKSELNEYKRSLS